MKGLAKVLTRKGKEGHGIPNNGHYNTWND